MCVTRVTEFWFAFSRCAATVRGVRCPCTRATPPPPPPPGGGAKALDHKAATKYLLLRHVCSSMRAINYVLKFLCRCSRLRSSEMKRKCREFPATRVRLSVPCGV